MKYVKSLWVEISCHECNSKEDVREIKVGSYGLHLCKPCRKKLSNLLNN